MAPPPKMPTFWSKKISEKELQKSLQKVEKPRKIADNRSDISNDNPLEDMAIFEQKQKQHQIEKSNCQKGIIMSISRAQRGKTETNPVGRTVISINFVE